VSRTAYLDCVSGIAGDMLLAALIDAGASEDALRAVPSRLGLDGVGIDLQRVERQGIRALTVTVRASEAPPVRAYSELRSIVEHSELAASVRRRALAALASLAEVEAGVHGVAVDRVHFHELGSADLLVDVCGAMALLEQLEVGRVECSALPFSRGLIDSAHGVLPSPAPATLALLRGAPLVGVDTDGELVTPTGAAIAATVTESWGPLPPLVLDAVGYGAGARDLPDHPNLMRVVLSVADAAGPTTEVSLLETNLDDFNPELVPDAVDSCVAAGALDVWTVPAQMKKGRPGIVLSALARPAREREVARVLLEETSALGLRVSRLRRYELDREQREVEVGGHPVRVKLGHLDGRLVNVAPEHDDCAAVAKRTGEPVKSVWLAALAASREP